MAEKRGREFWREFFRHFARSNKSLADYCRGKGVSYKTARNWSSKLAKEDEQGQGQSEQGQGHGEAGQGGAAEASNGGDLEKSEPPPDGEESGTPSQGKEQGQRKWNPGWANLIPAGPGNQRALKHGAYAKHLPPDVIDTLDKYTRGDIRNMEAEIQLVRGRLIVLTRLRAQWDAKVEYNELDDTDYLLQEFTAKVGTLGEATTKETTTKRVRPDFEMWEDRLLSRLAHLQQVHEQLSKRISMTADEAAAARREILERADEEGWSAVETGTEIEKLGLELPFTLQQRIRAELALMEPEEPEGGMTDDELERLSQQYEEQTAGEPDWLAERREQVADIHAERDKERQGS